MNFGDCTCQAPHGTRASMLLRPLGLLFEVEEKWLMPSKDAVEGEYPRRGGRVPQAGEKRELDPVKCRKLAMERQRMSFFANTSFQLASWGRFIQFVEDLMPGKLCRRTREVPAVYRLSNQSGIWIRSAFPLKPFSQQPDSTSRCLSIYYSSHRAKSCPK